MERFGIFDEAWHIPLSTSIFHNNIYPPKDFFRPDYLLLYHFGGDLLAGAISHLSKTEVLDSFIIICSIFSGVTILAFFSIAYFLSGRFNISLISSICCYFVSGFIWINSIANFFLNKINNIGFIEHFLETGIRGTFLDPPFITAFSSTSGIGYAVLILILFLFSRIMINESLRIKPIEIFSILIPLFTLSLFAGWLALTFLIGASAICIPLILIKRKKFFFNTINIILLLGLFFILNKLIGNQMYSEEEFLGRANLFDVVLKEQPFTITIWSGAKYGENLTTSLSVFSYKFLSDFGLGLVLLPLTVYNLAKSKNIFSLLLFLCAALTMPMPIIFDFKLNPVDFNRLFGFGNTMLVLLSTWSISTLRPFFFSKKAICAIYIILFCFSPLSGFVGGTIFPPQIYLQKDFTKSSFKELAKAISIKDFFKKCIEINKKSLISKSKIQIKYKNEIDFYKKNSRTKDVVISSIPGIPIYSGTYTLIPSMLYGLKNQIYSPFDNIYPTIISTLDLHLIKELNIRWVAYDEISKSNLTTEALSLLKNNKIFTLKYKSKIMPESNINIDYEIFEVQDLSNILTSTKRKSAWVLVNRTGTPIEIIEGINQNINVFKTEKEALKYLKTLQSKIPRLHSKLITAQPIIIDKTIEEFKQLGLNIILIENIE